MAPLEGRPEVVRTGGRAVGVTTTTVVTEMKVEVPEMTVGTKV